LIKIDQAKTKLNETNDKAMREVKEKILPLQKTEGENVKRDKDLFRERVIGFKVEFGDSVPKNVKDPSPQAINEAYAKIGLYYNRLKEFERQRDELANKETLFDLDRSIYKELKECNNDLINLKKMWDLIALVDMQFENWKKTRWDKINVDDLQTLLKEIATKQCNQQSPQNKEFKGWYAFKSLNDRVKNMGTVLPLVALLHSEFMLDRHWESLAQNIVKKHIKTPKSDPTFCLNDLIVLKLHEFSDDVNELVDGAAKEDKISKKLDNIERIWETLSFNFESREDGIPLLIQLDQVTENLDQHLLDLMGMMSSKDVEFFRTKVETWTKTLKTVEAVIDKWVKVQKDYLKLQPIFLQSEDIRTSLPDETKKFEVIDQNFRAIMQEAQDDPKVTLCAGSVE
jgi:dynein heavy chain, axonemal